MFNCGLAFFASVFLGSKFGRTSKSQRVQMRKIQSMACGRLATVVILASLSCAVGACREGEVAAIEKEFGGDYGNFDPAHVVQVELEMDDSDWDALRSQSRSFYTEFTGDCRDQPFSGPYSYFPADISIDGESLENIGIRKKGFIGSQSTEKPSLKINLDEYVPGVELFGTDNVTLNNQVQDPSQIRQCIAYALFADAGIPAPRCNFAHVWMNGQDLGIYAHVEPVKRSFLRDHFGNDDGDLYEGTLSDFREGFTGTFDPKNSDTDGTMATVEALSEAMESPASGLDELAPYADTDAFLDFWAMETITGHWDGYSGNLNNFYIYDPPGEAGFQFIPWGLDDTLDHGTTGEPPFTTAVLPNRLLSSEDGSSLFEERVSQLFEEIWDEDKLLDEVSRIEELLLSEPGVSLEATAVDDVRAYLDGRRSALLGMLPSQPVELDDNAFCLRETGTVEAGFSTTWGTLDDDTFGEDVDISVVWEGTDMGFSDAFVAAGISDQGAPLLVVYAPLEPGAGTAQGAALVPYLSFDPDQLPEDGSLEIDQVQCKGELLYTDNSTGGQFFPVGGLYGGSVDFDSFGDSYGDEVSGSFSSTFYSWQ
jgi:spore coat protein CotH